MIDLHRYHAVREHAYALLGRTAAAWLDGHYHIDAASAALLDARAVAADADQAYDAAARLHDPRLENPDAG